jgi:hypothetical protein
LEETTRRTPDLSLRNTFLRAVAAGLSVQDERAAVVGEALEYLQRGFDAHYAGGGPRDDDILVGDNAYALAVETIARLDEPRFVAVASRMIRDGAGRIAEGGAVTVDMWAPHLAGLLDIISEEGAERSEARIREAAEELRDARG